MKNRKPIYEILKNRSLILIIPSIIFLFFTAIAPFYFFLKFPGLLGPLLVMISLFVYIIGAIQFSLTFNGKIIIKVFPFLILFSCISLFIFIGKEFPNYDANIWLTLNKKELCRIEKILKRNPNISRMSDGSRFIKELNDTYVEGSYAIKTKEDFMKYFAKEIAESNININALYELKILLNDIDVYKLDNHDGDIVYRLGGFIDSEYGILKIDGAMKHKKGDFFPSIGRKIEILLELNNGYYYWST